LHGVCTSTHHGERRPPVRGSNSSFLSGRHSHTVCNIPRIMTRTRHAHSALLRPAFRLAFALGVGAALFGSSPASATDVRGRLVGYEHLRNPVWVAAKDPNRHGYSFREPVTTVPAGLRKLFPQISKEICIFALGTSAGGAGKPVGVRVSGGRTTPMTLVVTPGTELRFKNADPFDHRLYGVGFGTFAVSTTAKGALRRWTPQEGGRYEIRDELSPSLLMWVVVEPSAVATAFPGSDGRFSLTVDQPGQYSIQAYFAGEAVGKPILVAVDKRDVDVSGRPLVLATKPPVEDSNP
jgi:plastocyanin